MGFFSLFGKRPSPSAPAATARQRMPAPDHAVQRAQARATALKIDAIESEMVSEFVRAARERQAEAVATRAAGTPQAAPVAKAPAPARTAATPALASAPAPAPAAAAPPADAGMGASTAFLLSEETRAHPLAALPFDDTPAIDEAAVMYAEGRHELAEDLLRGCIESRAHDDAARLAWAMLFDLYELTGQRAAFDQLSLAWAQAFETSPPLWHASRGDGATARGTTLDFSGKLDASLTRLLPAIRALPAGDTVVRLDFTHMASLDMPACALLLGILKALQAAHQPIALAGAAPLLRALRAILQAPASQGQNAPWLLLLECYRLLDMETEFEECSLAYCVAFEVSPPAFTPVARRVSPDGFERDAALADAYRLPDDISDRCHPRLEAMAGFAVLHDPAVFDATALKRIDFHAASVLQAMLQPMAARGRRIEFRELNHLVLALLRVVGLHDIARLTPRR